METTKKLYLMLGRDGYPIHRQGWELIETADLPFLDIDLNEVVHFEEWEETDDEFGNLIDSKIVAVYMSVEQLQLYLKVPYNVVKALVKYQITKHLANGVFRTDPDSNDDVTVIYNDWRGDLQNYDFDRLELNQKWLACTFNEKNGNLYLLEVLE